MNVLSVEAKGDKAAILNMEDGTKVWTPELDKAKDLAGKPIPADWTQKQGDYGPQAFPPREKKGGGFGGGAAAFRNTKEGFLAEQDSIHRSVALKLALKYDREPEDLYAWLSKTSSGPTGPGPNPPGKPKADEARPVSAPRSNIPAEPGEESAGTAELVVEGSGDGFCPNYSDHSFVKLNGTMTCKKCGAVRM